MSSEPSELDVFNGGKSGGGWKSKNNTEKNGDILAGGIITGYHLLFERKV